MKLITELTEEVEFITEESDGKKSHYIQGVFLQSDITNRNGRMYPYQVLDREVKNYKEFTIPLKENEGKNFIGKAKLLDTPMGNIAKNLLDEGVKLGVSSRGMGTLKRENGYNVVGEDFMLATAGDIVSDPSAPDAFVEGIMEGKEWVWEGGLLRERQIAELKHEIDHATLINLQERKVKAFERFIRGL